MFECQLCVRHWGYNSEPKDKNDHSYNINVLVTSCFVNIVTLMF